MRAVVDTNVFVSGTIRPQGNSGQLLGSFISARFELVLSDPLLAEIEDVLSRPEIARRYHISPRSVALLIDLLRERAEVVLVTDAAHGCRDPKDDIVIETALRGNAEWIVSGDPDLIADPALSQYLAERGVAAVTVAQFLATLGSDAGGRPIHDP